MSVCYNTLTFEGSNVLMDQLKKEADLSNLFQKLEVEGIDEGLWKDDIEFESSAPFNGDVSVEYLDDDSGRLCWRSESTPSTASAAKLSMQFPEVEIVLDYEVPGGQSKGSIIFLAGDATNRSTFDYEATVVDLLVHKHGILSLKEGEEKDKLGCGHVAVICKKVEQDGNKIVKTFNVQFQCDESTMFVIHVDSKGKVEKFEYSDEDENEDIEDTGYYDEMLEDLQDY